MRSERNPACGAQEQFILRVAAHQSTIVKDEFLHSQGHQRPMRSKPHGHCVRFAPKADTKRTAILAASRRETACGFLAGWLVRKYFRISSPSVAASGCLQILQRSKWSRDWVCAFTRTTL